MVTKAQLARLEKSMGADIRGDGGKVWAVVVDQYGTLHSGWADPEEWRHWHPEETEIMVRRPDRTLEHPKLGGVAFNA